MRTALVVLRRLAFLLPCLLILAVPGAAGARGLTLGIFDGVFLSPDAAERTVWLDRTVAAGGRSVRIPLSWPGVAPRRPANPTDPADPAYAWAQTDAAVDDARARGLGVLLSIDHAPRWAEGRRRPSWAVSGSWKPSPAALGAFAQAAAARYGDRVKAFQVWNEPNLVNYLVPQSTRTKGKWRPYAPAHYRRMLNAAYRGIKAVDRSLLVVTAGTGPYGDPRPGARRRIMPVRFWRNVLAGRTRFDVIAHHPYAIAGPNRRALNADDAALPDIHKIRRLAPGKRFWITEVSWDSRPPDPFGVPAARHAQWLAEAFYVLWRQGVDTVFWFQVRDAARGRGYAFGNQSGLHLVGGGAKRARDAYAFPFVARRSGTRTLLWGLAPADGTVTIERRTASGWQAVGRATPGAHQVFQRRVATRGTFRARIGAVRSLPFSMR